MNIRGLIAFCAGVAVLAGCGGPDAASPVPAPSLSTTTRPTPTPEATALVANPLYRAGKLTSPGCRAWSGPLASIRDVRAYYTEFVACLNKAWAPVIRRAGFTFTPPKLVVAQGPDPTVCGRANPRAYYCDGAIRINVTDPVPSAKSERALTKIAMADLIAHEYGHHVQELAGIDTAYGERRVRINEMDAQLEWTRRMELQANCFGGAYLGAVRESYPIDATWTTYWAELYLGSDDHGTAANARAWSLRGTRAVGPAPCNTFTAPSRLVR